MLEHTVNLLWDEEAAVWVAASEDIPGLVLESGSLDALIQRVLFTAPDLVALNNTGEQQQFSICFKSERHEKVYL